MTERDVIRARLLASFELFTRYFFKARERKKFIVSDHHEKIIETLIDVFEGRKRRVIINIAPRYGKTELAVKSFIAYSLACNPKAKFIHLSYADQLALDNSEAIKDLIQSHEYQELFPEVQVKKDSKAKNKWYTTQGGGVLARSASGQVTGFGAGETEDEDFESDLFGGAIIIDDPLKPEDADSNTVREKVNQRFDSTIRNRVNSRKTPIIVIMQRLHLEDLSGYLLEKEPDKWDVITLPAIVDEGTEDERALWEHKHTLEELKQLKKVNESVFLRQYMQDPQPQEGLVFPKNELNYFQGELKADDIEDVITSVDIADGGGDAHAVATLKLIGKEWYLDDVIHTKDPIGSVEDKNGNMYETVKHVNKHRPNRLFVETNMGGGMYPAMMKKYLPSNTTLVPEKAKSNKHTRIVSIEGWIKKYVRFRADINSLDYERFMKELTRYDKMGKAEHDDAPDVLANVCKKAYLMHHNLYGSEWDGL